MVESTKAFSNSLRVAVLADFTPAFLIQELNKRSLTKDLEIKFYIGDTSNFEGEIFQPDSDLYTFEPNRVLIALSGPNQWEAFMRNKPNSEQRALFGYELFQRMKQIWKALGDRLPYLTVWQTNLTPMADGIWGGFSRIEAKSFAFAVTQFNHLLGEALADSSASNVSLLDWVALAEQYGTRHLYDYRLWVTANHPYHMDAIPALAKSCLDEFRWEVGFVPKVVVVDLDNTLWGGEVGDLGFGKVTLSQEGFGRTFYLFQLWLRSLKDSGIILAIASHNDWEPVLAMFSSHPEMLLSLDDFAAVEVSWSLKSKMITSIADELNVSLDSIVFLDDSTFVRNEVRSQLPDVLVPELPEDHSEWLAYLGNNSLFLSRHLSRVDDDRTEFFHAQKKRKTKEAEFKSYPEYLKSLKMVGSVEILAKDNLARAFQLVQRTNQFNLRSIRYSELELERFSRQADLYCRLFGLKDIYGQYGIVSLVIIRFNRSDPYSAILDTWVMSCRVFQRQFEHWILNTIVEELSIVGIVRLTTEIRPTKKNGRMQSTLTQLGWESLPNKIWCLDLQNFKPHPVSINYDCVISK